MKKNEIHERNVTDCAISWSLVIYYEYLLGRDLQDRVFPS